MAVVSAAPVAQPERPSSFMAARLAARTCVARHRTHVRWPSLPLLHRMIRVLSFLCLATLLLPDSAIASEGPGRGKAFLLSLVLPGLGHRYVNGGDWDGAASLFVAVDAGLWLALAGTSMRYDHLADSYRTFAASRADADVEGKDRTFFLTLGTFRSSEDFVQAQLRNRTWDQLEYVADPTYQWQWASEADFLRFRELREDAETMRRRRPVLAAVLVGNRLLSGILALRAAGRVGDDIALRLDPHPWAPDRPALTVRARL